jgi:phosphatidylserine/phosphatidylglycerophosphate/cardiolipin synthase-like enzyme
MPRFALAALLMAIVACEPPEVSDEIATDEDALDIGETEDDGPEEAATMGMPDGYEPGFAPGAAFAPGQRVETVFSAPRGTGDSDLTIEKRLIELMQRAKVGSKVRIAMFHWGRNGIAEAVVAAAARGVDVRVVLDSENSGAALTTLQSGLGSKLTLCTRGRGSCIGTSINHNKFFLFSALDDGSTNVVAQSSANLTDKQLRLHNNMVLVRDDAALFAGYEKYFEDLAAQKADANYARNVDGDVGKAFMFPRSQEKVVSVLDNVTCGGGGKIRVAMAYFVNRPTVAKKFGALKKAGCDVKMIVRRKGAGTGKKIMPVLRQSGIDVSVYPTATGNGVHSKYLLIDATFNGTKQKLVFTGSHNYTNAALHLNDETLLRVDDASAYAAYLANWNSIRAQSN